MGAGLERERKYQQAEAALKDFFARTERAEPISFETWCAARPEIADELRELHALAQRLSSALVTPGSPDGFVARVLAHLARRGSHFGDYKVGERIGLGGMGEITLARDELLRRDLALKRLRPAGTASRGEADSLRLARFFEEAQVMGQLDHPGIVSVHELGLDAEGRVYFTMKLVKGEDLSAVFEKVARGEEGWSETRAVGVLLKVCEAMAYAHEQGVIHRDLKPGNVMVGRFGEVYVMDWGLARVLGQEDRKDIRIRTEDRAPGGLRTDRSEERGGASDYPILTMDGDTLGTPAYMPPEQARGALDQVDRRADVYALGAMLHHLLAGRPPYARRGETPRPHDLLMRLLEKPPEALHAVAPRAQAELIAITEKAMARDPDARYADMLSLAEDLRAYLEQRVVSAYETGALAELRKWVARNRALAAALAAGVLVLAAGLVTSLFLRAQAEERSEDVLRLSALQDLEDLLAEADELWPAHPSNLHRYEDWLDRTRALVAELPVHRAKREQLRAKEGRATSWWTNQLSKLIAGLEELSDRRIGLLSEADDAVSPGHGWSVPRRVKVARRLEDGYGAGGKYAKAWAEVLPGIHAAHPDLELEPQLGLVPIGKDPVSDLWEFAHLETGEVPVRDERGELVFTEDTGLVFVLLPGGTFSMGSQASDPAGPNHDPRAQQHFSKHEVTLSPFFLSKYETTQGQWLRATGTNPSLYGPHYYEPRLSRSGKPHSLLLPVEQVSWMDCTLVCKRLGLTLPTEAQWEYAARGGTTTIWSTGSDPAQLAAAANLGDVRQEIWGPITWRPEEWDDGYSVEAPVGSFAPNPFGLFDVHGNVWEWCLDGYDQDFYRRSPERDPVADATDSGLRVGRGGGYTTNSVFARSAYRGFDPPESRKYINGLRPARRIDPR